MAQQDSAKALYRVAGGVGHLRGERGGANVTMALAACPSDVPVMRPSESSPAAASCFCSGSNCAPSTPLKRAGQADPVHGAWTTLMFELNSK